LYLTDNTKPSDRCDPFVWNWHEGCSVLCAVVAHFEPELLERFELLGVAEA
jgi:hypothetical protein